MRRFRNQSHSRASRVVVIATAVVAGVAALAGVLVGSGQAGSSGRSAPRAVAHHPAAVLVKCGDTITTDARLTRDLNNCPADGVIIGAAGVTLDLDGYTIDGVGAVGGIGVNNSGGYDDVTVKDGTVHQFLVGIRLQDAEENRLSRLTVSVNAGPGIAVVTSDDNRIERVSSADNDGDGISLDDSDDNRVWRSSASDNLGSGITVTVGSDDNRIERSSFIRNGTFGIAIEQNSDDTRLERNTAIANQQDGIFVQNDSFGTRVRRNVANQNGNQNGDHGIDVENAATTITRNTANENADLGIEAVAGVSDGGGNRARGNGNAAQCMGVVCT
jgi:parallel beta-helix repeat protein